MVTLQGISRAEDGKGPVSLCGRGAFRRGGGKGACLTWLPRGLQESPPGCRAPSQMILRQMKQLLSQALRSSEPLENVDSIWFFLPRIPFAWHLDINIRTSRTQGSRVSLSPAEIKELALHPLDKLG